MAKLLSHQNWCLQLLLITSAVSVLAESLENISPNDQPKPIIFIERLRPPPPPQMIYKSDADSMHRSGLYVIWQKLLVRASPEFQFPSVLSKSFGVMKVAERQEMEPINMEEMKWRNIAAEFETEKRIVNSVLLLMKILLALDIAILLGVFLMLLGCFCKSKEQEVVEEVVKA